MRLGTDSFEALTDTMSAKEAQAELLKYVRYAQHSVGDKDATIPVSLWDLNEKRPNFFIRNIPVSLVVLWEVASMLNPRGKGFWKLELKQRRRGQRKISAAARNKVFLGYYSALSKGGHFDYEEGERILPLKTIRGQVAKKLGMTDEAVRKIIERDKRREP